MIHLHRTEGAREGDALLGDRLGEGHQVLGGLAVGVGHRYGHWHVEDFGGLFEPYQQLLPFLGGAEPQAGDGRVVDPALEEPLEVAATFGFHGLAQVVGARLLEAVVGVILPHAAEEVLVADQPPQHVEHGRALVVDQRAEHAAFALDVAEPIAQIHRALIRVVYRPPAELAQDVAERLFATPLFREQRREVLREALAQPLLVVVLPAHRLPEPLVRQLVRHEELGEARERRRVVAPVVRRDRRWVVDHREIARRVAARQFVFHHGDRDRVVRHIAGERGVQPDDVGAERHGVA